MDQDILIDAVNYFKMENPVYSIPSSTQLHDGPRNSSDHWYHIYFYYPEENYIVKSWIRQKEKGKTILAFVAINRGLKLSNWRFVNKDFSKSENREQKRRFEERIVLEIKKKIGRH